MTDEINDEGFEPVGPANADVANEPKEFKLYHPDSALSVGDTINTSADGFFKVVDGGRDDTYFLRRITEESEKTEPIHYLEKYALEYR